MLSEIKIENFRCFENLHVKNFDRINLIGGLNNCGKSYLLESILLNIAPNSMAIEVTHQLRGENLFFQKSELDATWNSLFYNQNTLEKIKFESRSNVGLIATEIQKKTTNEIQKHIKFEGQDESIIKELKIISAEQKKKNYLTLETKQNGNLLFSSKSFILDSGKIVDQENMADIAIAHDVAFFSTKRDINILEIAKSLDGLYEKGYQDQIISFLKIIDPSISEIRTSLSQGRPDIMISRSNQKSLPIRLFGDAIKFMIEVCLTIMELDSGGILLIDEIENGIHYSKQEELWIKIHQLCVQKNIQLFATTHSREMIEAFCAASLSEDAKDKFCYIELIKNTEKTYASRIEIENLEYKIKNQKPFRGEF